MGESIATSSMARVARKQIRFFFVVVWIALLSLKRTDMTKEKKTKDTIGNKVKVCMKRRRTLWCTIIVFRRSGKMLGLGLNDHRLSNMALYRNGHGGCEYLSHFSTVFHACIVLN